ncbi:M20/M25/M40 family metallo-hydrolase [Bacillus shivajii]|uniref:M20/M25/M40 family metallo-hydrolase n=1 Tax=Bacillus shivajii TaxID=1983719 RepID=UPI001CFB5B35|nr:M20/M25/M40 family metallo-hydrolase [Bacillus shivajii]UCZ55184.1 M20/M25/M40 family metallo-hydrolase [Bacillus shivajii]
MEHLFTKLLQEDKVQEALHFFESENEKTLKDQIELTAIPAPTFDENERGSFFEQKLNELHLEDIQTGDVGNVFGIRKGSGQGPKIVVSAHLDTVFPAGTNVDATFKDGKVYAPGIADDGRGLAVLLTLLKAFNKTKIKTVGDIIFLATVGEEGLGDLRGVKSFFNNHDHIDAFISIEPGSPSRIIYEGTGSRRYIVQYKGSGGHSFGDFGTPSAIHALGRAVAMLSDMKTPDNPKTTFNVGTVEGGTTVNTIAANAKMVIDLRSTDQNELLALEEKGLAFAQQAANLENERWGVSADKGISVEFKMVGNRPAGTQSANASIVKCAEHANNALNIEPNLAPPVSTDSNVPISLGVPAVTLGGGGDCGGMHTLEEYFNPEGSYNGPQHIFLMLIALAGVQEITKPIALPLKINE